MEKVYLSLGGNVGNAGAILNSAMQHISSLPEVFNFKSSRLYKTSPISPLPQPDFLNTVCTFDTSLKPMQLLHCMQEIEKRHGKLTKPKNAPRSLDIDVLFYGNLFYQNQDLQIPHPRWKERLFVLIPLAELVEEIFVPNGLHGETMSLRTLIQAFFDHTQRVELFDSAPFV